jgi:hypothetical protein
MRLDLTNSQLITPQKEIVQEELWNHAQDDTLHTILSLLPALLELPGCRLSPLDEPQPAHRQLPTWQRLLLKKES